jgi:hypothetical protein
VPAVPSVIGSKPVPGTIPATVIPGAIPWIVEGIVPGIVTHTPAHAVIVIVTPAAVVVVIIKIITHIEDHFVGTCDLDARFGIMKADDPVGIFIFLIIE